MARYLVVNELTYAGDPQARADALGLPLALGLPPSLVTPLRNTSEYILRDGTHAKALLTQLLNELDWFVVRVCGEGYAPVGQGIPYPPSVNLGALTAETGLADGAAVNSLTDLSGTSHNATLNGTPAPVFRRNRLNGKSTIEFTTGAGRFRTTGTTVDQNYTFAYLARMRSVQERMLADATPTSSSTGSFTLGGRFVANVTGTVTHIRWHHSGTCPAGTIHTLSLWNSSGVKLATVPDPAGGSPAGWREVTLPIPLFLSAGQTYTVSTTVSAHAFSYTAGNPTSATSALGTYVGYYSTTVEAYPNTSSGNQYHIDVRFLPTVPRDGRIFTTIFPPANWVMGFAGGYEPRAYSGAFFTPDPQPLQTDQWRLFSGDGAGSTQRLFQDGTLVSSRPAGGTLYGMGGNLALGGYDPSTAAETPNWEFAECLVYDSKLSDANRALIEGYLRAKWLGIGTTSFVPTSITGLKVRYDASALGGPISGTFTNAKTSRGTITATFTTLAANTRFILHADSPQSYWQVRYTGAGWQVEQVVGGVTQLTGDFLADTATGTLTIRCGPNGVGITTPSGFYDLTEAAVATAPMFGYILAGATAVSGPITFVPEFQIAYFMPGGADEVPSIPDCDEIFTATPQILPVATYGEPGLQSTVPVSPTPSPPSAVASVGLSPDYEGLIRAGVLPPVPPPALNTHSHGREEDWRVSAFIPPPISGDTNNYNPPGWAAQVVMFLSSDSARSITGLVVPPDTSAAGPISDPWIPIRFLINIGAYDITLTHEDAASSPEARFALANGDDLTLAPAAGVVLVYDYQMTARWHSTRPAGSGGVGPGPGTVSTMTIMIGTGGSVITTGVGGTVKIPANCNLTGWEIGSVNNVSGSIVVELWSDSYANFPPTNADIVGTAEKPTLASQVKNQNTALNSGAGYPLTGGNWLTWNVASATSVTLVALSLTLVRT